MPFQRTIAAGLLLIWPALAQADYAHCSDLHDRMPDRLAGLERVDGGAYPEKELGFFDKYRTRNRAAVTVFLYDYGHAEIGADEVRVHFEAAVEDMEAVALQNGVEGWVFESELNISDSAVFLEGGIASSRDQGQDQHDVVLTGMSGPCLVKLRLTSVDGKEASLSLLGEVAGGVERALDP